MTAAAILAGTGASGSGKPAAVRALEVRARPGIRCYLDVVSVNARAEEVLGRPGMAARTIELGADAEPLPGLSRAELVEIVSAG